MQKRNDRWHVANENEQCFLGMKSWLIFMQTFPGCQFADAEDSEGFVLKGYISTSAGIAAKLHRKWSEGTDSEF